MNIGKITERFELLTGLDKADALKWRPVIDEACDYVGSRIIKEELTEYDRKRIDVLSAVYAYRIYCMTGVSGVSSFAAGEVKITSSADDAEKAELLWQEYLKECKDIICADALSSDSDGSAAGNSFLFGAVRV